MTVNKLRAVNKDNCILEPSAVASAVPESAADAVRSGCPVGARWRNQ